MSQQEAFEAGKSSGSLQNRQAIRNDIGDTKAGQVVNRYSTTNPPASSYWTGNQTPVSPLMGAGTTLSDSCSGGPLPTDPQEAQRCEAIRALKKTASDQPMYSGIINKTDPLYLKGKAIRGDPESVAGAMNGAYSECTTTTQTSSGDFLYQTCDEALVNSTMTCSIGQKIVVDADHFYQCTTTIATLANGQCTVGEVIQVQKNYNYQCQSSPKQIGNYTCKKTLIVTCDPVSYGCASQGIVPNSLSTSNGGFYYTFDGTNLSLVNTNSGVDVVATASFRFNISGKDRLTQFYVRYIASDNWLGLRVNGVYLGTQAWWLGGFYGPPTSDRLEAYYGYCVQYNEVDCYPSMDGHKFGANTYLDLRPYLLEGTNVIDMYVVNDQNNNGVGIGRVDITTEQQCTQNCYDYWDNQCATLESRL